MSYSEFRGRYDDMQAAIDNLTLTAAFLFVRELMVHYCMPDDTNCAGELFAYR